MTILCRVLDNRRDSIKGMIIEFLYIAIVITLVLSKNRKRKHQDLYKILVLIVTLIQTVRYTVGSIFPSVLAVPHDFRVL